MLQLWCADCYDSEEGKEHLIEVEATSINVSDSSGDEDVSRVYLMII